jgi:hypothetical protein
LIVNDHGSENSEVEDDFECECEDDDKNKINIKRGKFMSPERTPSFFKLNNNKDKKSVNNDEVFTPNTLLTKTKSKADSRSKKLLENKSVDFKKKSIKKKSSKKITNLNDNNDDFDNDVKFNSRANLLDDATLSDNNVSKLK